MHHLGVGLSKLRNMQGPTGFTYYLSQLEMPDYITMLSKFIRSFLNLSGSINTGISLAQIPLLDALYLQQILTQLVGVLFFAQFEASMLSSDRWLHVFLAQNVAR